MNKSSFIFLSKVHKFLLDFDEEKTKTISWRVTSEIHRLVAPIEVHAVDP